MRYNIDWILEKFDSGEKLKYLFFWGHNSDGKTEVGKFIFSQWFEAPFTVDDIVYPTAEHWMMACKARLFGDESTFLKIVRAKKPGEVKELGRQVQGFDDALWKERCYEIVKTGNMHKFNQNPELLKYLLSTQDRILVEASPVDVIWGVGMAANDGAIENPYSWKGQNLLGFALMEVRDLLTASDNSALDFHK